MNSIRNWKKLSKKNREKIKNAERMVKYRAKIAMDQGREIGVNGRPTILSENEKEYINYRIYIDSLNGLFHPLKWLVQLVCSVRKVGLEDDSNDDEEKEEFRPSLS
jgi:hypothetical protein